MKNDPKRITVSAVPLNTGEVLDMRDGRWEVVGTHPLKFGSGHFAVMLRPYTESR
jgi:hypothetical protein